MLSYLQGSTRPEISMAVHQCARFCNNTCIVHERTIRCIAKYLASMSTYVDLPDVNWRLSARGVVYRPNIEKGIECYVYYEFSSGWSQADAHNAENVMSRTGYVITYTCLTPCTIYIPYGFIPLRWINIVNLIISSKPRLRTRFVWTVMKYIFFSSPPKVDVKFKEIPRQTSRQTSRQSW